MLVAICKLQNEQSLRLLGELRHKPKQRFNTMLQASDAFVKEIEDALSPELKETLQSITDALHDGVATLRNDLVKLD